MKRLLSIAVMASAVIGAAAQDTYESAKMADRDLNGTARYVGMGGAMEALGADISTISTNPAGTGLMRKSQVAVSLGPQIVSGNKQNVLDGSTTTFGLDQAGGVLVTKMGSNSFLNFGFNYTKSRNFNQLITASDALNLASQNKISCMKYAAGVMKDYNYSVVDDLYNFVLNGAVGGDGKLEEDFKYYYNAVGYATEQRREGFIADYGFNVSGNVNDRVYLGVTFGLKDVHYRNTTYYTEALLDDYTDENIIGNVDLMDERETTGTGFDIKLGVIARPIENSPFRIGAYVHTPTWYKLKTTSTTDLSRDFEIYETDPKTGKEYLANNPKQRRHYTSLEYRLNTPWVFGLSVGHTIDQILALGLTYEYSDYTNLDNRVIDDDYYDYYYGEFFEDSHSDRLMKRNTRDVMQGSHTLKAGMEVKVTPELSVRAGYNYVSPKYKESGFRDQTIESQGTYLATTTDYTNWKATNRVTFGLGYAAGNFFFDAAYMYSQTDGDYYPFMSYLSDVNPSLDCMPDGVKVSDKRSKLLFTLGWRF